MRKINKGNPIEEFSDFVRKNKPTKWEDLDGKVRSKSRMHILLFEQDCLCGYSEMILDETNSHVDHYVKQEHDSSKIFDWNNYVVSTIDEDFGGKYKDNGYKIKKNEYSLIFNPVDEDMSLLIEYSGDGEMIPIEGIQDNEKTKVSKTIAVFNLNHNSLKAKRSGLLRQLNSCSDLPDNEIKSAFSNSGFVSVVNWWLSNRSN